MICDLAETYGIYDYRALPIQTIGTLVSGLRDDSRTKMKLSGMETKLDQMILATIADRLGLLVWMQTKDGQKGRKRPKSILEALQGTKVKEEDIETFDSGNDFEKERKRLKGEV